MADHQVENNSDGVSAETKPFGSLKNYWENMSNQRMEADCSVPTRPNVVVPTKTEKVSKHACVAPMYLPKYLGLTYILTYNTYVIHTHFPSSNYVLHTYLLTCRVCMC